MANNVAENKKKEEDIKPAAPEVIEDSSDDDEVDCDCKPGAPEWIVTFADLSTLMLTFFILMLSFANTDIQKFKDMLGSVQDAFGVQKDSRGKFQARASKDQIIKQADKATNVTPQVRRKKIDLSSGDGGGGGGYDEIAKTMMKRKIESAVKSLGQSKNIKVKSGKEGVRVKIKGGYFFGAGKSALKENSKKFLDSIAHLMKEFPFKLKVEGHTDNIPISSKVFPSNWELSAIRATTVLRYFIEKKKISKKRLMAIGYADNKPIANNKTKKGRAKNRRVEFVFSK